MATDPWAEFNDPPPATLALERLRRRGAQVSNGFRTEEDVRRLKRQGYTPAEDGPHNRGDGVDLVPGGQLKTLRQLEAHARKEFGQGASVAVHNGTHVHVEVPGWGYAPDTARDDPWSAFKDAPASVLKQRGSLTAEGAQTQGGKRRAGDDRVTTPAVLGQPTGRVVDGDTFGLSTGRDARLFGVDAPELRQQGQAPSGGLVPLGVNSRDALAPFAQPNASVLGAGSQSYGRPVVSLNNGGDAGLSLLQGGNALAAPSFLQGSSLLPQYMEAERGARLNRRGAWGTNFQTPQSFRAGNPDPWESPEASADGKGVAYFFDDPTPQQGLRPEIAEGYLAIWNDPKSKPEDLLAYAKANGFKVDPTVVRKSYASRFKGGDRPDSAVSYISPPRVLTDPGDGRLGVTARGVADPINMLDEMGAVVDTLGLTGGRENVFGSDRRFGDILANNLDQNRSILAHDAATHPNFRLGGQLASGVLLPYGAGARTPMALARLGAVEGGLAGFGAGEGSIGERVPTALGGAALGAGGGVVLGHLAPPVVDLASRGVSAVRSRLGRASSPAPSPRPQGTAAMAAERGPELVGPMVGRQRDYINTGRDPWAEFGDAPFGVTRNINERMSSDEMARLAEGVDPASVLPRPGNVVESLDEAVQANPGRFAEMEAPDEFKELGVRAIPSSKDMFRSTKVRGPLDMTQTLRTLGGIQDQGGNLKHLGIDGSPRKLGFGGGEQFLGRLVDNDNGMPLDEAAHKLWEMGYFPEHSTRPTIDDLLGALHAENTGAQRYFRPDDLEEVERFGSAQADRYRIEDAAASGRPLVEDRGHEINLDDLVANTPPVGAYEDMPRLTGRVGNINLDRLERPQDVAALIDQISKRVGGFDAAARGKITHDETRQLAQEIGLKPEQLLKRRQGQALNAEQLHASRVLVQASRESVARLAKRAVGGTDDDKLTFRKAWLKHVALEEQIAGATAEVGRALSAARIAARAQEAGGAAVRAYLKGTGSKQSIEDAAEAIVDLMEDPAKASHFMREAVKPRWRDKFNELWVNSLLSGPRTHIVNFVGNALTTTLSFPEQAMTAAIGKVTRSADRAYFGEVGARAAGLADSSVEALRNMRQAFKTGEAVDETSKVDAVHQRAIGGKLGHVLRTPTRALTAADEFWKTLLTSAEMRQLAYRQAKRETSGGEAFKARYEALLRSPTESMTKQAHAAARYYTFQKELGPAGRGIQQVSNNWIGGKILLPFVRTPINLLKFAGERSPLAVAMPEVRQAIKAGGRARHEALARITLGSGLSTAAVVATLDGRVTGSGPSDPRERAALLQAGWQPNSIRIGDQWVSYARFDPVSTLIGVAADFAEAGVWATKKEADAIAMNLATGIAKNVTNKTWLSGLSDAFDVLSDPERYGKGYVQRLAGSAAVPAAASQTAQALDPHLRDARTIMDAIKRRVPVLSQGVPVRRNVWGEPVSSGDAIGPDVLSPFYATTASNEPFRQEIARLRAPISMPRRYLTIEGRRVDLTPEQYDKLVQLSGAPAKQYLEEQIRSPEWRSMNDGERREFVKEALADFRQAGRAALLELHPELVGGKPTAANDAWGEFEDAR